MNNLFEFTSEIKEKIRSWSKNLLSEIKSTLSLGTQNSSVRNEVGKYIALDISSGLAENNKEVVKAFLNVLDKLKYERSLDLISEDEYYTQLERLRNRYFAKGTQNWLKYTAEIYTYQKKSLEQEKENIVSMYDDISRYAEGKLSEIIDKQSAFAEKIKDSGKLFDKNNITLGDTSQVYYSMHDMRKDIENIKLYKELLEDFSKRSDSLGIEEGIKKGFLKELSEEDFYTSIGLLKSIKANNDKDVFNYLTAWNERNILADSVAAKSFEDDFNQSVEDAYENMKDVLMRAGYEIPEGFFASGSLSAQKFGDAFVGEIETQMERIRSIIDSFNSELSEYARISEGVTYNTSNTSYNIQSSNADDTVEKIRRYETVKRLAGIG
ncbi:MAG: hypothetical protein K5768_01865 [Firmicutes bacterium]|nr:hypothetical protein [Bacillota bacterium]